ncbi:haloacid dehalogenase [Anaerocolumna cellulosilytica]|uniref:Haloacid dehalogenase n=1 Tax=Anaerocolumna cellulosilytica TaxID=433286 RepID=A0A6S6QZN6_9FIRM|nr:HAD family phosphatase [Anaerocolumna cellulosilytica]MBB5194373.1 putative hydrolase of the HAD superfamily [Anaerocolumna cellulosilytica]BCJ93317.1 haloacid dehalogenase [Anaerocolumna cellulosilytica]
MIKTIVLDIGQVLAHFRWQEYLQDCGYDEETIRKIGNATVLGKYWGEQDRGAIREEELIKLCCDLEPEVTEEIRKFFEDITLTVREYPYAEQFIKDLKSNGYKVYLLSNYGDRNFQYAKEHFRFVPCADGGVISYEIKHIKPEPEIYQALLDKYQFNPKEAVFLDDSLANLEGAKAFGFSTIHVTNFNIALEELRNLGIKI